LFLAAKEYQAARFLSYRFGWEHKLTFTSQKEINKNIIYG
jgi:hypothetical protein